MSFLGPRIIKINGGLGQKAPSDRNVAGLVFANGYTVGTTFVSGNSYELNSLDDAEALGLSAATDANALGSSTAMCYYHISEYFRLNPDGKLYVYNGNNVSPNALFTNNHVDGLLGFSNRTIRHIGIVVGISPSATITLSSNMLNTVWQALPLAQQWVEDRAAEFVFIDNVVFEGYAFGTGAIANLTGLNAPQVSVVIGHDRSYLEEYLVTEPVLSNTAAVGTVLGSIGVRMLAESIGSVVLRRYPDEARGRANYSLVDTRSSRWLNPYWNNDVAFDSQAQSYRDELTNKGYIYMGRYEGYEGVYLNGDATCAAATDDYNTIHINRVWNEAARRVRRALIPRMNSMVDIDPDSGRIKASTIADWDAAAKRELNTLLAEGEISDFRFTLDPNQDVIGQGKVVTKLSIVPQGIAKVIEAEIGFNNPAQ